jgi:SAM-dependent methyltransferase
VRWFGKQLLVRWDAVRHRRDPSIRQWIPVFAGARSGHVAIPSRAIASSRGQAADFVRHRLVLPGDRVLDVGAGNGRQAIGLLEIGIAAYTGLEVIKSSVDYGNHVFVGHGDVRFDWLDVVNPMYNPQGRQHPEAVVFPYHDEAFDFAVASSLYTHLEHLEVVERYVRETARVVRTGGGAFMSFFRSPPNAVATDAVRSVFREDDIRRVVGAGFVIEDAIGGHTTGFHDQWMLYLRKP